MREDGPLSRLLCIIPGRVDHGPCPSADNALLLGGVYQRMPAPTTYQIGYYRQSLGFAGSAVAVCGTLPYGVLDGDSLLGHEHVYLNTQAGCDTQAELYIGTAEVAELARDNFIAFRASDALH